MVPSKRAGGRRGIEQTESRRAGFENVGGEDRQDRPIKTDQNDGEVEEEERQDDALNPDELDAFDDAFAS